MCFFFFYLELISVQGRWCEFILIFSSWLPSQYHLLNNSSFPHLFEMPLLSCTKFPYISFLYQLLTELCHLLILILHWTAEYAVPGLCSSCSKRSKFICLVSHCSRVPAGDNSSDKKMQDKGLLGSEHAFFFFWFYFLFLFITPLNTEANKRDKKF